MTEVGQSIIDIINEKNKHKFKSPMMHYCFIRNLMNVNLELSKIYNNKAYSRYTWRYINKIAYTQLNDKVYPNFQKMDMYFGL